MKPTAKKSRTTQAAVGKKAAAKGDAAKGATIAQGTVEAAQSSDGESWSLRLYVAGQTPKSLTAMTNLQKICEEHLPGKYKIEVIDLLKTPQLAQGDQIVAIPTLVRKLPAPLKRVIGDLSNIERVLVGMDIQTSKSPT